MFRRKKQSSQLGARAAVRATGGTSFRPRCSDLLDQSKPRRMAPPSFSQYPRKTSGSHQTPCKAA
jgi:hypothetical protein